MRSLAFRRMAFTTLIAGAPALAMADAWQCDFTAECALATGCTDASFSARLIAADHAGELFLTTAMGDSPVIRLTPLSTLPASYAGAGQIGTAELLTIEVDRTAILSVHHFDGTAVALTYFGTCAELN
ncbi:hypothetical protein LSUCC0031_08695 [Rhodobacterales bacterium LSUCC0031]|nr:hypothetical protein [Rhodobacterales bacterium LSUCC0031]